MSALVGALLLALGCGDDGDGSTDLADGLRSFSYQLTNASGFCPQPGSVGRARIVMNADGELECELFVVASGNRATGECLTPVNADSSCLMLREAVVRTLRESEQRRLLGIFRDVRIGTKSDPDCSTYDPCVVKSFDWVQSGTPTDRSTVAYDGPCAPRLSADQVADIERVLDDIRGQ